MSTATIATIILIGVFLMLVFIVLSRFWKKRPWKRWHLCGLCAMVIGFLLLAFAPAELVTKIARRTFGDYVGPWGLTMEKGLPFELFTCGPDGLLKAVAQRAVGTGMPGWISMDRHMICGVGACFACIQRIKGPDGQPFNARCCINGPVFAATDIIW